MDLAALAEQHRAKFAGVAADVRNVRPSIRDFERYVTTERAELAVVGELRRKDPDHGPLAAVPDAAAFAKEVADGGAYGVSVCVEDAYGGSLDDVRIVSAAVSVPVLAHGIVLDEQDLYRARDAGADAVVVHAALHDATRLTALRKAARSMRIEIVVLSFGEDDFAKALASEATLLAVSGSDLSLAKTLLARVPKGRAPILYGGVSSPSELEPLLPHVDTVVLVEPLMSAASKSSPIAPLIAPFTSLV